MKPLHFDLTHSCEAVVAIFFSHMELAYKVWAGKDIASVYTLDSCPMGTETRD